MDTRRIIAAASNESAYTPDTVQTDRDLVLYGLRRHHRRLRV